MTFSDRNAASDPIFKELNILKLEDLISTKNVIFVHKTLNNNAPSHFKDYYDLHVPTHNYNTVNNAASTYSIPLGSVTLSEHDSGSIKYKCAQDWNDILKTLLSPTRQSNWLLNLNISNLKSIIKAHIISAY